MQFADLAVTPVAGRDLAGSRTTTTRATISQPVALVIPVPFPIAITAPTPRPRFATGDLGAERRDAIVKVGKPYQVAGRWYTPRHEPGYQATGVASWYGADFHGKRTANGEIYNKQRLTAAHPTLPLPSYVSVTNIANGRTVIVRVNDRGPYARGRVIDVSQRAAELLGFIQKGMTQVRVAYVGPAPIGPDDKFEQTFANKQSWAKAATRVPLPPANWSTAITATP